MSGRPINRQLGVVMLRRLVSGILAFLAVLFVPAGTVRYWEAWVFMAVLFIPMTLFATHLLRCHPSLLERRMRIREREKEQRWIVTASSLGLVGTFVIPGFDRRFGWSSVPIWVVIAANTVVFLGYLLFMRTLLANEYAGRTVEVEEGQRLISTGPYAAIRHPLYLAAIWIFTAAPLALGSFWALLPAVLVVIIFLFRIREEEKVLTRTLPGYAAYCRKVRYRLIPGIW
jgi:protein-S-isoprenylcysteine O-methyltransferase Ste14